MENYAKRLTVSMPCFGRPQRTIRAIECIANQNINDWEALVTGDGCPIMKDFINSNYFTDLIEDCKSRGNIMNISNNSVNKSYHGYAVTNQNIKNANGRYFVFYANDDVIQKNHFDNYLSEIEGTHLDFVFYNSWVNCNNSPRISQLKYGSIGHSELIIRTKFLKSMPPHEKKYGHDFDLIQNMISKSEKYKKADSAIQSYWVMSTPDNREQNID